MKKLLSLLIILSSVFTVSINAREIDNKGGTIQNGSVFTTGDVLKNTNIGNRSGYSFYSPFGYLYYKINNSSLKPEIKIGGAPDNSNYIYNEFYIHNANPYAFTSKNDEKTDFVMPTYYGDNILWRYNEDGGIPEDSFGSQLVSAAIAMANFKPISTVPKIKVVCDKDNTNVGETIHCDLLFNEGYYRDVSDALFFTNVDFNLTSDDYEISNVVINKKSAVTYSNNHVSGNVIDINEYNDFLDNIDRENENEYKKNILEYFNAKYICLQEPPKEIDSSIDAYTYARSLDYCYQKADVTIKLLSFDITSNGNSESGLIKLSDVHIAVDTSALNLDVLVLYENEKEETAIPIVGLVKGVEENPKTGLFNYLLLIIPIGIFAYGIYLLKKKTSFKTI